MKFRERNVIKKDWRKVQLRIAFCYPNIYRVGMTSLATHLLYFLFNSRSDVACERVFYLPGEQPRSLESRQPLDRFDVLAFSFQFETDYSHAIEMLLRSGISPLGRKRDRPWIIAGGPAITGNPLPIAPFIDFLLIGDLEPVCDHMLDALIGAKSKVDLATQLGDHFFSNYRSGAQRAIMVDLNQAPHPRCQVVLEPPYPSTLEPTFGQSLLVEISRGCDRHCNFCLTGHQCSPRRERHLSSLQDIISEGIICTGVDKVAFIAAALTDHSQLSPLAHWIVDQGLQLSVPSLRADLSDVSLLDVILRGGQRTLTFAPEAGSQRLRELIGKPITEDTYRQMLTTAIAKGFNLFKLYFIIGLPTETNEDVTAIVDFCTTLARIAPQRHRLHVSIAPFIPKAHTPFQWCGLTSLKLLKQRITILQQLQRIPRVVVDLPNPRWSVVQAGLSRGTAELTPLILAVAQKGRHTMGSWFQVARNLNIDLEALAITPFSTDAPLPWDPLDARLNRNILLRGYKKLE